jgi:hypothetical protein
MPGMPFMMSGWRPTAETRLVQGWFRVRLQRLYEHRDGRREWRKEVSMAVLPSQPCVMPMPPVNPTMGARQRNVPPPPPPTTVMTGGFPKPFWIK